MTETQTPEMWWPSPEAFGDLVVEDAEHGFDLSAPDDTECGEWLGYWSQDEAHHKVFQDEFITALTQYANKVLDEHGQTEAVDDEQSDHRIEAEEVGAR
jgi:hypothetical protein